MYCCTLYYASVHFSSSDIFSSATGGFVFLRPRSFLAFIRHAISSSDASRREIDGEFLINVVIKIDTRKSVRDDAQTFLGCNV